MMRRNRPRGRGQGRIEANVEGELGRGRNAGTAELAEVEGAGNVGCGPEEGRGFLARKAGLA